MVEGALLCVFFGDSITAGQYVEASQRWTSLLPPRMAQAGFPGVQYAVGAVSGDTTRMGLERFGTQVQALRPHVLTIQFGLNDCNRWETDGGLPRVSQRAYAANLHEMIDRARHFGTIELILMTSHPTLRTTVFDDGSTYENGRRRYNEILRCVARRTAVRLLDMETAFPEGTQLAPLLQAPPDALHLNPAGHARYADALAPVLQDSFRAAAFDRRTTAMRVLQHWRTEHGTAAAVIRVLYVARPGLEDERAALGPVARVPLGSDCELGVSLGGSHIFTPDEIALAANGIVNLHFAPLPEFRGRYSAGHALRLGESVFGATLHYVDAGIDTGPIIAQCLFAIDPRDTLETLRRRAFSAGIALWREWAPQLVAAAIRERRLPAWPQDEARARYFDRASRSLLG